MGYSLGGGIAVHFANVFPHLVSSLVLLAPAGLIRTESYSRASRFLFQSGFVPERLLAIATRHRLKQPIASNRGKASSSPPAAISEDCVNIAVAESSGPGASDTPLERRILEYVRWSLVHNSGFVPAFMSSIRYAPGSGQHASWSRLARRDPGTTVVLLARHDEMIDVNTYTADGLPLLGGEDFVCWRVLPGGHNFVITHVEEIMKQLDEAWGLDL